MSEKKNIMYKVMALGLASLSLAEKKGKEFLQSLENEVREKKLEEKVEKKFSALLEKVEKLEKISKEKLADFFGIATSEEIDDLKKEIENLKHGKQ
ncbi:MAG: hypothetical protein NC913_00315 [Candidatus Omnitrophica bacterium]|nr:hypothetical protein [Candidatus Omnitrophota bacterium]